MKKELLIFGTGDIAQLAHYYFSTDSDYKVVAFTVDSEYRTDDTFCDLPVIAFEEIASHYSPEQYDMFIALSYSKLNEIRKEKYFSAKEKDYPASSMLQWFVDEQVEEEASADEIVQQLNLMQDAPGGLYMLDQKLDTRVFTPPTAPKE